MPTSRDGSFSRRDWLRLSALGLLSGPASGWLDLLATHARAQTPSAGTPRPKRCVLLFMEGGPSHVDTFDPKPENPSSEIKSIATSVPGVRISEHFPRMAAMMNDVALLRGMSTTEGSHGRARYYMHTGYREGVGGVVHPSLGAVASAFNGDEQGDLPGFVSIGTRSYGAGYAGPAHAPVEVSDPARGVENLRASDGLGAFDRRVGLLEAMETGFVDRMRAAPAEAHRATYRRAAQLMHSSRARAFDLEQEPAAVRQAYGDSKFGEGCLLARRLIEQGVTFVEVTLGQWDTHIDNAARVKRLSEQVDPAMASLINDLKVRGLLDDTLVIWMGEFGRTPTVGKRGGRDHYPKAWTTLLAGGGLKTGQAVGRTDRLGGTVEDRPVSAIDFMATVCQALDIDGAQTFQTRTGRPMRVVDKGAKAVAELF